MKNKLKKALLILAIVIFSLVALLYGSVFLGHKVFFPEQTLDVPTIEAVADDTLTLGVQAHSSQAATIDEYLDVLAGQVKRYNELAPELWPGNSLTNQSIVVEEIRKNSFWLIKPNGTVAPISKNEALEFGFSRASYFNGFKFFDGGVYLAVAESDVSNCLLFQKYLHLGTYDPFITFVHEGFHGMQGDWSRSDSMPNMGRDEFNGETAARAKRNLLLKQILRAVNEPDDTGLLLDALATYEDYKTQFPEDYRNSIGTDRSEGTAFYFELISCLYSAYPDQIKNRSDLDRALALLATREDVYVDYGLVAEGYYIGGFTCVLLDRYVEGWQSQLADGPEMTPLEMLDQHFSDEILPAPVQLTQAEVDAVDAKIQETMNENSRPHLLFRFLYDMLF